MSGDGYTRAAVFPALPKTARGTSTFLGQSPNGDKFLYCNGNSVYIVPTNTLNDADIYSEHSVPTTVAKMSPSGYYIASGDNSGNVRLWDATQSTHILKATYPVFFGAVRDIAWNDDSKRVAAVGDGKEKFGHVFLFDTGTSNGNLTGQARPMTSVDFRPARPFRIISGSEDNTVGLFEGPPFKFKTTIQEHTKFVLVTKYNPDGSLFASASSDGRVVLYEGNDGAKVGELSDNGGPAHKGSVFGLAWSPCGKKIATASGDRSVKIWNVPDANSASLEKTVEFGSEVEHQQVGVIWSRGALISVSLSGFLNFIDPQSGSVSHVRYGHNKPITALAVSQDKKFLFTADFEGVIIRWSLATGESKRLSTIHKTKVVGLHHTTTGDLLSVAFDDTLAITQLEGDLTTLRPSSIKLAGQPKSIAANADGSVIFVTTSNGTVLVKNHQLAANIASSSNALAAINVDSQLVAHGGDRPLSVDNLKGNSLENVKTFPVQMDQHVTAIGFSPNGEFLAVGDSRRRVTPYSVKNNYSPASEKEWAYHQASVTCLAWSPDSNRLVTGSVDNSVIIWNIKLSGEHPIIIRGAHASAVTGVAWISTTEVVSVSQDANVKIWTVSL